MRLQVPKEQHNGKVVVFTFYFVMSMEQGCQKYWEVLCSTSWIFFPVLTKFCSEYSLKTFPVYTLAIYVSIYVCTSLYYTRRFRRSCCSWLIWLVLGELGLAVTGLLAEWKFSISSMLMYAQKPCFVIFTLYPLSNFRGWNRPVIIFVRTGLIAWVHTSNAGLLLPPHSTAVSANHLGALISSSSYIWSIWNVWEWGEGAV